MMFFWLAWGCNEPQVVSSTWIQRFPPRQIQVREQSYTVEFACKEHEVALGLRYRTLQKNEGVILCATSGSITMEKMKSPISVAFISSQKKIISVHELELHDSDLSIAPDTKWVWEMPKGWFVQNSIQEGMQIDGL